MFFMWGGRGTPRLRVLCANMAYTCIVVLACGPVCPEVQPYLKLPLLTLPPPSRRVWAAETGHCLVSLLDSGGPPVSSALFTPNDKYILAGKNMRVGALDE